MRLLAAFIITCLALFGNLAQAAQSGPSDTPDGRVNSGASPLRLRAGPGLNYTVLDLLPDGTPLAITARTADSTWLEVRVGPSDRLGWVYTSYVAVFIAFDDIPISTGPVTAHLCTGTGAGQSRRRVCQSRRQHHRIESHAVSHRRRQLCPWGLQLFAAGDQLFFERPDSRW